MVSLAPADEELEEELERIEPWPEGEEIQDGAGGGGGPGPP